ncbi:MAG TPA: helix-turn-helix domain-containing protein, partial [Candidatus Solibacter sp.]|nr:helix-turn-helix domain-containing protein [Candidatus Solibacter sp.]
MARVGSTKLEESRRLLVERVAASRYFSKSARLRDLLMYLCEHSEGEIHEQEIGERVFGRARDYDTSTDNIVRVHASTLRKRLEQYFAEEGAGEPVILEIPRGNYTPVFRERELVLPADEPAPKPRDWRAQILAATVVVVLIAWIVLQAVRIRPATANRGATVQGFWTQVYRGGASTDIVLDDAALGLYQELTGKNLALSDYFDRSYMRGVDTEQNA